MQNQNELSHVGVLGMKWGRRIHRSAAKATSRDAADLRKHGYKKEAAAVQKVSNKEAKKARELDKKIKEIQATSKNKITLGKRVVNTLMTPVWSETRWSDMTPRQKKKTLAVTAAILATVGVLNVASIATL